MRVERPRLRRRAAGAGGEVEIPAYAAMRGQEPPAQRTFASMEAEAQRR